MKLLPCAALLLAIPATMFAADLSSDPNYKTKCAACHGANGEGKAAMKTVPLKQAAAKSAPELTGIIENGTTGTPKMPGFKGKLTPDQVKALVAAIKGLK